ncbi:MAG: hypothetical protein WC342_10160, partial [Methanoregula sp.]
GTGTPVATASFETYSNPDYGISLSYPAGWDVQETDPAACRVVRDYGKQACTIVTFYSPQPNATGYSTVRVDVGDPTTSSLEEYFNQATVSLEDLYHPLSLTRNNFQLRIANQSGYRLEYLKKNDPSRPGTAVFTMTKDHIPYIIVADNGNLDETMLESFTITPVSGTTKSA